MAHRHVLPAAPSAQIVWSRRIHRFVVVGSLAISEEKSRKGKKRFPVVRLESSFIKRHSILLPS